MILPILLYFVIPNLLFYSQYVSDHMFPITRSIPITFHNFLSFSVLFVFFAIALLCTNILFLYTFLSFSFKFPVLAAAPDIPVLTIFLSPSLFTLPYEPFIFLIFNTYNFTTYLISLNYIAVISKHLYFLRFLVIYKIPVFVLSAIRWTVFIPPSYLPYYLLFSFYDFL